MASMVFLVKQACCGGELQPGDLLVHTARGFQRIRLVHLDSGAVGMADLDGNLEALFPAGDITDLEARAAVNLISSVERLLPSAPPPFGPGAPPGRPTGRPSLRLLK